MPTTILTEDGAAVVEASLEGDRVVVDPDDLATAIGWELKAEGLCRGDRCVPVRDTEAITHGAGIDVVAVAAHLGSRTLLDTDEAVLAVGVSASRRAEALRGRVAPDFALPDLEGEPARLADWRGRRRLLVAFASW